MLSKKGDKIIFLIFLAALLAAAIIFFTGTFSKADRQALIEQDGQLIYKLDLHGNMAAWQKAIELDKERKLLIIAEDGQIWMESSTCPNQICVNTGKISKPGQSIICLPYKLAIYIEEK